jgi:hypothetical protein
MSLNSYEFDNQTENNDLRIQAEKLLREQYLSIDNSLR